MGVDPPPAARLGRAGPLFEGNHAVLRQLHHHQEWLARLPSHGSSANNHILAEMAGQFAASCAFPWFPESAGWREAAAGTLRRELATQTFAGGLNRELATEYHGLVLELGLAAALEGERAGRPLGRDVWDTLRRMMDALAAIVDVRLRPPRQGDADDGHGLLLDGPSYDRWASLLATGATLFGPLPWWPAVPEQRRAHRRAGRGSPPGRSLAAAARSAGHRCSPMPAWPSCSTGKASPTSCGAGPTTARTGTCRSPPTPTPTPSRSSVRVGGVDILADPGTYCYGAEPAWRAYFRSTVAHNTLEVGGVDQSVAAGPHLWTRQARAELEHALGFDGGPVASRGPPTMATGASARRHPPPRRPAGPAVAAAGRRGLARNPRRA